ncbi:MAG: PIG-L family deacetylase [Elusimicrobia bacterium]|nr:PIG-L family deacetylase [Elusimicrobiota bacterium]
MKTILVLAPHPDDETLGCGGTLLRLIAEGASVHWAILTRMTRSGGYSARQIRARGEEIRRVSRFYRFAGVHQLPFPAQSLSDSPRKDLVAAIGRLLKDIAPEGIFLPHRGDVHSDHRVAFEATASCLKAFRCPSLARAWSYETLSETDAALPSQESAFCPNSFCDITAFLERKVSAFRLYAGEIGAHPFPRSADRVRALALWRGGTAGFRCAEAFCLLQERW